MPTVLTSTFSSRKRSVSYFHAVHTESKRSRNGCIDNAIPPARDDDHRLHVRCSVPRLQVVPRRKQKFSRPKNHTALSGFVLVFCIEAIYIHGLFIRACMKRFVSVWIVHNNSRPCLISYDKTIYVLSIALWYHFTHMPWVESALSKYVLFHSFDIIYINCAWISH